MKKFLQTIFILVYAVVAVTVTVLLLSYNDYKISEIGEKTVYPVTSDLSEKYKKGCLLIINKAKQGDIKVGDKVFYYRAISKESFEVVLDTVIDIEKSGSKETYLFEGNEQHGIDDIIGKESNTKAISIDKNSYNENKEVGIDETYSLLSGYVNQYKSYLDKNLEKAYELLDDEYREKKFQNSYEKFID